MNAKPSSLADPALAYWSIGKKMFFRFFALYFTLYCIGKIAPAWWRPLVKFLADHVLEIQKPVELTYTGSGDGAYFYVQVLSIFLMAFVGSFLWGAIDHTRKSYNQLLYWLMVLVRYTLATAMVSYGFAKIFKYQFVSPGPYSLFQPLGLSSPMGLVWKFMGYSTGYNYFTGLAEVLAGVFLFSRRTSTFGALLAITVLVNIVALNFFFDVPVKLYSIHLLLMAMFVAAPDVKRLITFFFLNKPVPAPTLAPEFQKEWMQYTRLGLKVIFLGCFTYKAFADSYYTVKVHGDSAPKWSLYGAYQIESFVRNGDTIPPLATDTTRWKLLTVNHPHFLSAQLMNDTVQFLSVKTDSIHHTISWSLPSDSTKSSRLLYVQRDKDRLTMTGHLYNDSVQISLRKLDLQKLPLLSRGFHWVNEKPYNR